MTQRGPMCMWALPGLDDMRRTQVRFKIALPLNTWHASLRYSQHGPWQPNAAKQARLAGWASSKHWKYGLNHLDWGENDLSSEASAAVEMEDGYSQKSAEKLRIPGF